jgi:hypothetical protein
MEKDKTTLLGAKVVLLPSSVLLFAALKNTLMSHVCGTLIVSLFALVSLGQSVASGQYGALSLAFDPTTKILTGYFEDQTGWDEATKAPRFSCVFYIKGVVTGKKCQVTTYYPDDKIGDTIVGEMELINDQTVSIKLPADHGGCWNVQHFADEPVSFTLINRSESIQIRYVTQNKAYFYSSKAKHKRLKLFVVKNDFVCVEKTEGSWAYCSFYGDKKVTKGWMKTADLNDGLIKKQ